MSGSADELTRSAHWWTAVPRAGHVPGDAASPINTVPMQRVDDAGQQFRATVLDVGGPQRSGVARGGGVLAMDLAGAMLAQRRPRPALWSWPVSAGSMAPASGSGCRRPAPMRRPEPRPRSE